jgi:glutaredoxin 3
MDKQTTHATTDEKAADKTVTVFSTPTCGFCHMAMDYFDEKGVKYVNRDITIDEEGLNFVLEKVGQAATPVITIGDEIIVGFDRPKIDAALQALAK